MSEEELVEGYPAAEDIVNSRLTSIGDNVFTTGCNETSEEELAEGP